jgi:hypothetical protein
MKDKYRLVVFAIFLSISIFLDVKLSSAYFSLPDYINAGYTCINVSVSNSRTVSVFTCTKTTTSTTVVYKATKDDYRTLTGYKENNTISSTDTKTIVVASPFLYLQNPPAGDISLSLDSQLNKYFPQPSFNQDNGWLLNSKNGKITINEKEKDHLFYELAVNKITLNRNGRNFSTKEELSQYLENSDFLTRLGFTEEQKKNSLGYFLPKLQEVEEKNFYYLTVLSDAAIAQISQLNIQPTPENIIRQYFAVYPTSIPVKTTGDFNFQENKTQNTTDFIVKETGEFLVQKAMQVFFE